MTADDRQHIRTTIDTLKRTKLSQAAFGYHCAGCHGDRDSFTVGCQTCNDRRQRRRRRERNLS